MSEEDAPAAEPRPSLGDQAGGESASPSGVDEAADDSDVVGAVEAPSGAGAANAYRQRAHLAEDRLAQVFEAYRGIKADNEKHRERVARNLTRRFEQRRERLLLKFIDILDNLDRALEAAEISYAGAPLVEGLILVRTQLLQTLREEGLERVPVLGLPYDPHHSEAVETRPVDDPDHHHVVIKDLLRGYRLNGKLARAARVIVGEHVQPEAMSAEAGASSAAAHAAFASAAKPQLNGLVPDEEADEAEEAPGKSADELTLEEIIARAEAQDRALNPQQEPATPAPELAEDVPEEPEEPPAETAEATEQPEDPPASEDSAEDASAESEGNPES